jgi:hypothetical protein
MSPDFWYRPEREPAGDGVVKLDGYQVATRLAAFVWSSGPDEELLDAADAGQLDTVDGVVDQMVRMMADPRADALVDNLAGQWFAIRKLDGITPDVVRYPQFDDELRASMQGELKTLLRQWLREGGTLDEVLVGRTAYVDQRLADEYVLPYSGDGASYVPVSTEGTDRYGLLGTAGFLAANSRGDGPSAVKRGKWILENLMCSPPPPPPPNVENTLVFEPEGGSVRQQEEAIRADEFCQTCHSQMDPLGFALNEFDAVGASRAIDEYGYPIDDHTVWNGVAIDGPAGLADVVLGDPRLDACVVQKTMTYALGRSPTVDDQPMFDEIEARFLEGGRTFESLAEAVVQSDAFRFRGTAPEVK